MQTIKTAMQTIKQVAITLCLVLLSFTIVATPAWATTVQLGYHDNINIAQRFGQQGIQVVTIRNPAGGRATVLAPNDLRSFLMPQGKTRCNAVLRYRENQQEHLINTLRYEFWSQGVPQPMIDIIYPQMPNSDPCEAT